MADGVEVVLKDSEGLTNAVNVPGKLQRSHPTSQSGNSLLFIRTFLGSILVFRGASQLSVAQLKRRDDCDSNM